MNTVKKNINRLFILMILCYIILLLIISYIACYYAYKQKKEQILSDIELSLSYVEQQYSDIIDNFWQAYMPIYEQNSAVYDIFRIYFTYNKVADDLSYMERKELSEALLQMKARDSRIQWIVVYSDNREKNYILNIGSTGISAISTTFPYLSESGLKSSQMVIYEAKDIGIDASATLSTHMFIISGGSPIDMGPGQILIGYSINDFDQSATSITSLDSLHYYITSRDQLIFDSSETYDKESVYFSDGVVEGVLTLNGVRTYVRSVSTGNNSSWLTYTIKNSELLLTSLKDTPMILSITLAFTLLAFIVHSLMNKSVSKEVSVIREGLNKIAENDFDYHLPTDFRQGGLPEIAQNINDMSDKLNENIKKAYYFELKQKDAQPAELQATFNPHFLYNTLEMLRSKSYNNGDIETSELISQLSALFRSLVGANSIVSLKEELAYSNRYLTLLSARYGDAVEIRYNISGDLLNYAIVKNVFQIIIENYFIHGFKPDSDINYLHFTGKSVDRDSILFQIEDNGYGMEINEMAKLNEQIKEPIRHSEKSYGLKNLNQRLKLFYGPEYGLHIFPGKENGIRVDIKIKKILMSEYETQKDKL
ncbi:MAG: histidine kinase, partial [Lachnospiraceae bacterium]|nr:histidine kinase [Lachnospiraceae bacterium]